MNTFYSNYSNTNKRSASNRRICPSITGRIWYLRGGNRRKV